MKITLLFAVLLIANLSFAQMFPWYPNQVILNEKDTFILVERIEFGTENRLSWFTAYEVDDKGIITKKTLLDGKNQVSQLEESIREINSKSQYFRYRNYKQEHQDSIKRLESMSCYDEKNRLIWEHLYDHTGEVIDSLVNKYHENELISTNTWASYLDWSRTVQHEDIGRMSVTYSDTGKFQTSTYVNKKHYQNGMGAKSSSTTTYRYDLSGNLLEECSYWDDPMAGDQIGVKSSDATVQLPILPKRTAADTLHGIIKCKYDVNNNLLQRLHSNWLEPEPFFQEHYEYDKKGRLIKSYQIDKEGVQSRVTLIEYRKKGKNTEVTSTSVPDKFTGDERTVSLIDKYGRYLSSVTFYDDIEASSYERTYQQFGDRYQVEMKEYYNSDMQPVNAKPFPAHSLTRWIYRRK